jgi:hypothetical protein
MKTPHESLNFAAQFRNLGLIKQSKAMRKKEKQSQ